jgi:hypothetical protein
MASPKPGYYAVLTANVRYDNELPPNVKLMYAEITALSDKDGYCTAGNKYFADLYDVKVGTVSGWISLLVDKGYIVREITRDPETQQITSRKLRLAEADPLPDKNRIPSPINIGDPPRQISIDNTKSFLNTLSSREQQTDTSNGKNPFDGKQPTLKAVRKITGRSLNKVVQEALLEALGTEVDVERLRDCFRRWMLKGYNPMNLNWATEWYLNGIPEVNGHVTVTHSPEKELPARIDYPYMMAVQQSFPSKYVDRQLYEDAKRDWLEFYQKRDEKEYRTCLEEVAAYEASSIFRERFPVQPRLDGAVESHRQSPQNPAYPQAA